jgi:hypothetical protein
MKQHTPARNTVFLSSPKSRVLAIPTQRLDKFTHNEDKHPKPSNKKHRYKYATTNLSHIRHISSHRRRVVLSSAVISLPYRSIRWRWICRLVVRQVAVGIVVMFVMLVVITMSTMVMIFVLVVAVMMRVIAEVVVIMLLSREYFETFTY